MAGPNLDAARAAVDSGRSIVDGCARRLAVAGSLDDNQVVAYDLAHAAAGVEAAGAALEYGANGDLEASLACAFVADTIHDLASRILGRESEWGAEPGVLDDSLAVVAEYRSPAFLAGLSGSAGPLHLDDDFAMVRDTFRRFADDKVAPAAEHVHRTNGDVPEEIIAGIGELGGFGLSVPEEYGGFASGGESDYMGMVIATEELSRGSLGIGGSLLTRPEILTRALIAGGSDDQKREWFPRIATGEVMVAVAVTEPDFGSDAGAVKVSARERDGGYVINGVKTWCTFAARADVLMLLARTNPDASPPYRGLSLFIIPKPRGEGHGFAFTQEQGGTIEGRAIDTIGYRGMHSYEVSLVDWWVPAANLIGEEAGVNRGYYLTLGGFENGRLQTAARAVGVMQAAYDAASEYAANRVVFGQPIAAYQLTKTKLARMAIVTQVARQFMYKVARLMATGAGSMEASLVKAYVCRAAEWVTREAMQIHGGMGYAEEFPVSRYFVDARVLSIFEGADELLALRVIAPRLAERSAGA